jgi:hypothetical protein
MMFFSKSTGHRWTLALTLALVAERALGVTCSVTPLPLNFGSYNTTTDLSVATTLQISCAAWGQASSVQPGDYAHPDVLRAGFDPGIQSDLQVSGEIMKHLFGPIGLLTLGLLITALQADGRQATSHVTVGTTVQAYAHPVMTQPTTLVITNKDVNLGYVSVPDGNNAGSTRITVSTNDRAGYSLVFQVLASDQPLFSSIQVMGLGTTVVLPATGGRVTMPWSGPSVQLTLTYRFNLAKKLKDSTYPWPFTVVVQPN